MPDDQVTTRRQLLHSLVLAGLTALALTTLTSIPPYAPPPPETVTSASPAWEQSAP